MSAGARRGPCNRLPGTGGNPGDLFCPPGQPLGALTTYIEVGSGGGCDGGSRISGDDPRQVTPIVEDLLQAPLRLWAVTSEARDRTYYLWFVDEGRGVLDPRLVFFSANAEGVEAVNVSRFPRCNTPNFTAFELAVRAADRFVIPPPP